MDKYGIVVAFGNRKAMKLFENGEDAAKFVRCSLMDSDCTRVELWIYGPEIECYVLSNGIAKRKGGKHGKS